MASQFLALARALVSVLFDRPVRVKLPTGEGHFYPSHGVVLPVIAGADGEGDDGGDGGDGDGDGDAGDAEGAGDGDKDDEDDDSDSDDSDSSDTRTDRPRPGTDASSEEWRTYARYLERQKFRKNQSRKLKRLEKENGDLGGKLKEVEDSKKSDTEKAIEKAKEEGRSEALTEAQKDRRADRLESAVTRAASKKIKVGEGDDAKTVRFEDPEDAEIYLQRKIAKGDLDEADLFDDDGKVKTDVIADALAEILEEKPRLAEDSGTDSGSGKTKKTADGDADQGKGKSAGSGVEDMSVEDHVKRLAGKK